MACSWQFANLYIKEELGKEHHLGPLVEICLQADAMQYIAVHLWEQSSLNLF